MACSNEVTANIIFDCDDLPIKGLEGGNAVLINYVDIDKSASTVSGSKVTSLQLNSGSVGFEVQWYRELASTATALSRNAEDYDGFTHSFLARLVTSTSANAERANELKNGRFAVVVKTTYGGTNNVDKFKVYGWDAGLELSELAGNSGENNSSLLFTLATREGTYEKYPYNIFLDTDYATSLADFDALFTAVV